MVAPSGCTSGARGGMASCRSGDPAYDHYDTKERMCSHWAYGACDEQDGKPITFALVGVTGLRYGARARWWCVVPGSNPLYRLSWTKQCT